MCVCTNQWLKSSLNYKYWTDFCITRIFTYVTRIFPYVIRIIPYVTRIFYTWHIFLHTLQYTIFTYVRRIFTYVTHIFTHVTRIFKVDKFKLETSCVKYFSDDSKFKNNILPKKSQLGNLRAKLTIEIN